MLDRPVYFDRRSSAAVSFAGSVRASILQEWDASPFRRNAACAAASLAIGARKGEQET